MRSLIIALLLTLSASANAACLVAGDSIAKGISHYMPLCAENAVVGRNVRQITEAMQSDKTFAASESANVIQYDLVIMSAGTNDGDSITLEKIKDLRRTVKTKHFVWIVPARKYKAAHLVRLYAKQNGDSYLDIDEVISSDKTHPTSKGYSRIAQVLTILGK